MFYKKLQQLYCDKIKINNKQQSFSNLILQFEIMDV